MKFKQILPYKLRRALTIGAIAGGTLTACEKNNEPQVIINPKQHDVELILSSRPGKSIPEEDVTKHAQESDVRSIYIVPTEDEWYTYDSAAIKGVRNYLEKLINIGQNKVKGKGNFRFMPGEPTKVFNDSLWYIQHGWTLNQK